MLPDLLFCPNLTLANSLSQVTTAVFHPANNALGYGLFADDISITKIIALPVVLFALFGFVFSGIFYYTEQSVPASFVGSKIHAFKIMEAWSFESRTFDVVSAFQVWLLGWLTVVVYKDHVRLRCYNKQDERCKLQCGKCLKILC